MRLAILLILLFISLSACSLSPTQESNWSNHLPAQSYFIKSYQNDVVNAESQTLDQYLTWVRRFYQGWDLYPNGWQQLANDLLVKLDNNENADLIEQQLDTIGLLICAEWAKNNNTRLITTRHISIWGNALQHGLKPDEVLSVLQHIHADVSDLLDAKLSAQAITEARYYDEEDIFKDIQQEAMR